VPQWTPGDEVIGLVCGHWLIEDRLHRVRNMDRHEERSHVRTSNGPRVTASVRNLAITILRPAGETGIGTGWRHHAPGGRLRLAETLDKPAHRHRNDEPQNYKGKSSGTNEYRSDSFHHAPIVITSICPQSPPPVRLTLGTLASSGGAKVLFIRGLQTPNQPPAGRSARSNPSALRMMTVPSGYCWAVARSKPK